MVLIPLLAMVARRLRSVVDGRKPLDPMLQVAPPAGATGQAIVVGHGRVGEVVCDLLQEHKVPFIAMDRDPDMVARHRRRSREVYYGNASNEAFLRSCGVMDAAGVIVTIHDRSAIDEIVEVVRALRPDILIVSRARDAEHAKHLYAVGVTDAVPETIEASLQLSEAALVGLGVQTGPAIASIHEKRDVFRRALQEAAGQAGIKTPRSIRAKTPKPSANAPTGSA
jgi:CPA2 family monovalent cation:H+ antiporter-2